MAGNRPMDLERYWNRWPAGVTDGIAPSDGFQPLSSQAMEALGSASEELRDIALANLTDNPNEIQLGEHAHLRRPS